MFWQLRCLRKVLASLYPSSKNIIFLIKGKSTMEDMECCLFVVENTICELKHKLMLMLGEETNV